MLLKKLFFFLLVKPLVFVIIGLNIRHYERLPSQGPAIIVANHNSHLDTLVLMSLFPSSLLPKVRPVAASDYFLNNGLISWIACHLIDIIPLERTGDKKVEQRLKTVYQALDNNDIVIIFPEGSRGDAERFSHFKKGIELIARQYPETAVTPVFLHGLGKSLPKGEGMFVPFICDVVIGGSMNWNANSNNFVQSLEDKVHDLARDLTSTPWT